MITLCTSELAHMHHSDKHGTFTIRNFGQIKQRWQKKGEHNLHLPDLHEEVRRVKAHFLHPNYTWNDKVAILASPSSNEHHCLFI